MNVPLRAKTGEFAFRMLGPEGRAQGKAGLRLAPRKPGGLLVEWELAFEGPRHGAPGYREARLLELDAEWRLISASYSAMGKPVSRARRDGGVLVGEHYPEGEHLAQPLELKLRDDACTGLQFVFAMFLPFDEDEARLERWLYNEAAAFRPDTIASLIHYGREESLERGGRELRVHRFLVEDEHSTLPVWINERHEIVQLDWGGGNLMVAAPAPPAARKPTGRTVRRTRRLTRREAKRR